MLPEKDENDDILDVYNERYLKRRIAQEFIRSKQYYLPLSLLLIHVPGLSAIPAPARLNFLLALSRLLTASCSKSDVVTGFSGPDRPFAVLAITTSLAQAQEIKTKIETAYEKIGLSRAGETGFPGFPLRIAVSSFRPEMTSEEMMFDEATRALG